MLALKPDRGGGQLTECGCPDVVKQNVLGITEARVERGVRRRQSLSRHGAQPANRGAESGPRIQHGPGRFERETPPAPETHGPLVSLKSEHLVVHASLQSISSMLVRKQRAAHPLRRFDVGRGPPVDPCRGTLTGGGRPLPAGGLLIVEPSNRFGAPPPCERRTAGPATSWE